MLNPSPRHSFWRSRAAWAACWSLLSALALLQTSPWVTQTPGNDSGIFLYFGAQILKGRLPFVHLWDHKPPLVFYLDALGLLLGGGSRWGVWAVEVFCLAAASLFGFLFLRRYFRAWPAFLALLGMLFNLAWVLEGGNLTEEYALAFQFAGLYLFARSETRPRPGWLGVGTGVLMGGAFLLKQTLVGAWVAMAVYLLAAALWTRRKSAWAALARMAAGFTLTVGASFVYFALRGGLREYWDVAFWFNFVYSSVNPSERILSFQDGLWFVNTRAGFFLLAGMAWLGGIAFVLLHHAAALRLATRKRAGLLPLAGALFLLYQGLFVRGFQAYALTALSPYRWGLILAGGGLALLSLAFLSGWVADRGYGWLQRRQAKGDTPVLLPIYLALIGLPVELALVSVSGRGYLHYYLSLFPPLTILVAFLAWSLVGMGGRDEAEEPAGRAMPAVWSALLFLPVLLSGGAMTLQKVHPGADLQTTLAVAYIREHTRPEETVLLWGNQAPVNYLAERAAPTRFVHQIPLINDRYATPERIAEFYRDLEQKKPALIIDTRLASMPLPYPPGNPPDCTAGDPAHRAAMQPVYRLVCAHYQPVATLGPDAWIIYRYDPALAQQSAGQKEPQEQK